MHCGRPLTLCVFIALSLFSGIVSSRGIVLRRQDSGISALPSTTTISIKPSNINNILSATSVVLTATDSSVNKVVSGTQSTTANAVASSSAPAPTVAGSYDGSNIIPENEVYAGGLPIQPKVTPGIGIMGVILMLAGVPLCLIGIKLKVLQIFLSTFFLSGLGVTVLIIYVMNPPVSYAIQGAYVTAVVITGIFTGCLAVVFPEVTEGLGCLLGGFCISMWFLVLKPGGLLSSTYGKLIMIAAFCFVTFSLAFHKITRPYSLIFSISFAGATATVLGIDCFSRAGLKEFWIYIWALNDNIFPLGTNNYPHTRGIRVEIAVIIIITAFGIMSQVKLWKILKERRDTKDAEKRRQVADLEALDEDVGRRVEEDHKVERAQWEVAYGGKSIEEVAVDERPNTGNMSRADSGIGDDDLRKKSGETVEEFVETEEMKRGREEHIQMSQTEGQKQSFDVVDQQPSEQDDQVKRNMISENIGQIEEIEPGTAVTWRRSRSLTPGSVSRLSSLSPLPQLEVAIDVPPTPEVIPLPIPISVETDDDDDDEISSLATWAESDRGLAEAEVIITPRWVRSEEDDEDRASSLAATCDDQDVLKPSQRSSMVNGEIEKSAFSLPPINIDGDITPTTISFGNWGEYVSEQKKSFLPNLDPQPSESGKDSTTPTATSPPSVVDASLAKPPKIPENLSPSAPQNLNTQAVVGLSPPPQGKCSKVVKNYRTNEWAKHLAGAEKPELEELEEPVHDDILHEVSVPVHVKELQETSGVPSQQPLRSASKMSQYEPVNSTLASSNVPSQTPAVRPVMRTSSIPIIPQDRQGSISPVERSVSPTANNRRTPSPLPQNTLMGKRESMVRSRQNFNTLPEYGPPSPTGSPDLRSQSPNIGLILHPSLNVPGTSRSPTPNMYPNDTVQYRSAQFGDDMPLASRRSELLNHSVSQNTLNGAPQQGRRSFTPQPQQNDKRQEMMRSWRESIKTNMETGRHTVYAIQERRGEMLTERQQVVMAEREKNMKENFMGEVLDERMRQKDMLELHKEALRKMQAGANKHI